MSNSTQASPFAGARVYSIDVLRGIVIFTMIFVNDLASVKNIPDWMKHAGTFDNTMTFVDVVFPAFLFIVGMAIPLAVRAREVKGKKMWLHMLTRTLGLLVLGVFMVNTEGGYHEAAMGMSIHIWAVLFYLSAILAWNQYPKVEGNKGRLYLGLKTLGIAGLIALFMVYRRGEDGSELMAPLWWGILGLIGWAYFWGSTAYLGISRKWWVLAGLMFVCLALYSLMNMESFDPPARWALLIPGAGHFTHIALVLGGMVLSLMFFPDFPAKNNRSRIFWMLGMAILCFVAGAAWMPIDGVSKNLATPSWALFSAGIVTCLYALLFLIVDVKGVKRWASFFEPAGSNPLLIYLLPPIIYHLMWQVGVTWYAETLGEGWVGILRSIAFASLMLYLVQWLNRWGVRMKL